MTEKAEKKKKRVENKGEEREERTDISNKATTSSVETKESISGWTCLSI